VKKILIIALAVFFPFVCNAYDVYLSNGSVIENVSSYEERGDVFHLVFGGGSVTIPKSGILRIAGEPGVEDLRETEKEEDSAPATDDAQGEIPKLSEETERKADRLNSLQGEMNSVYSEIRTLEERESRLVNSINERTGRKSGYNIYELKSMERELEPLRRELADVQQRKTAALERRNGLEAESRRSAE
jgi:predicted RNase H-like nuclease (RuvC/YqgF family)